MAISDTIPGCWCIISTDNYREEVELSSLIQHNEIENRNSEFTEMMGYW